MMEKVTTHSSYLVNFIACAFGVITLQELGVFVGIILGIATFITNLYFKNRQDVRQEREHYLDIKRKLKETEKND